jgi:hypothetical protein
MKAYTKIVIFVTFGCLFFQAGGQSVENDNVIVLRDRIDEQDKLVTLNMYHEEKSLGGPTLQRITDSSLTLGRAKVLATKPNRGLKEAS